MNSRVAGASQLMMYGYLAVNFDMKLRELLVNYYYYNYKARINCRLWAIVLRHIAASSGEKSTPRIQLSANDNLCAGASCGVAHTVWLSRIPVFDDRGLY